MAAALRRIERCGQRRGRVEPEHVGARHHDRGQRPVVEQKDVAHHLVLVGLDDAGAHALLQAGVDLGLGDSLHGGVVDAQQLERGLGGVGEQPDEGLGRLGHQRHGARDPARNGFGVDLADALGHQFAKDDGDEGDDQDHQHRRGDAGRALGQAPAKQDGGQVVAVRGLAHDAVEHADRGDAHLHRGQKLGRVVHQLERGLGAAVAAFGQRQQARLAARGQGQLRHGKSAIEQNQKQDQQGVHNRGLCQIT